MRQGGLNREEPTIADTAGSKRASPLMIAGLAALGIMTSASALFAFRAIVGPTEGAAPTKSEWRLPTQSSLSSLRSGSAISDVHTLTRPVFSKSRRPHPSMPSGENAATEIPTVSGLTLGAVVQFHGSPRAYIFSDGTSVGEWLFVGEKVRGLTVTEIGKLDVTIQSGAQSSKLRLYPEPPRRN